MTSSILDQRFKYTPSDSTNITRTLRAHGFAPPERSAEETEQQERYEGALRAMLKIQSEMAE